MKVVVLGAGLAGLAGAYELSRAGVDVTVVEKGGGPGGMAASFQVGPYWLDHGPHRFHSRDAELISHLYEILDGDVVIRMRQSRILLLGKYFDYPLKAMNVVKGLPTSLLLRAMADYVWVRVKQVAKPVPDDHFENWVLKRFGRTLYDLFFGTYTAKAWCMPCTQISADWASQRIAQANLWDTIVKTLNPPREGEVRSLVTQFYYPAQGGVGQIARKYAEKTLRAGGVIRYGSPLQAIELRSGRAVAVRHGGPEGEQRVPCDFVINTIPLPAMLQRLEPAAGPEVHAAIAGLRYIGIVFIYLAVDLPSVIPDHWIYIPSPELTVHRISEFKNFSDAVAPGDSTAVCCEITCRPGEGNWNLTLDEGARIAEADLVRAGLLKPGQARPLAIAKLANAYPVYDLEYKPRLAVLQQATRQVSNLMTTGRQGLFRYNNMDHSIAMGRRMAAVLLRSPAPSPDEVASSLEYFG